MREYIDRWEEEQTLPIDVLKKLGGLGFAGIIVKEDVGGSNMSR